MTKQNNALRLAELLELAPEDGIEPQTSEDAAAELRRLHTENTALQQGYVAARLEIESLQARIKTMAEEHADELMVAHLDGRMRAAQQPAPSAAVASKAVLAAIRAANMQLVRTGDDEFMLVTLKQATPQADTQPAPQHEAQEPVAWYVTGCGRLLDEYEAEAEARRIGGTAKAMPLYTVPQPSPASQGDALDAARLDWLLLHISGAEFRRIGVHYSGNARRADVDAARAAQEGKNHD